MVKRIFALIVSTALAAAVFSCEKEKKNQAVKSFASPEVTASDGTAVTLPVSGVYPIDPGKVSAEGMELFCKKLGIPATAEAADSVWFGENIFGAGLASVVFFGKYASSLDVSQWETLAAIAADPDSYSSVLEKAPENGIFSPHAPEASRIPDSAFLDAMTDQIADDISQQKGVSRNEAFRLLYSPGVKVESSLRLDIQSAADKAYSEKSTFTESYAESFPQSAFAAIDYSGNVLALCGGNNGNKAYNRAWRTLHPLGSSIKPLSVYTPALCSGRISFSSLVDDSPIEELSTPDEPWPRNYDLNYDGSITVTYALRQSKNTVPVKLVREMGAKQSFDFLTDKLGFTTLAPEDADVPAMSLGYLKNGVSVTELAAAYEIFGSGGSYTAPSFYTKVTDSSGSILCENKRSPAQVITSQESWIMNRLLYYNISKDDGIAAAARLSDGTEVIGKTGTVDNGEGKDSDRLFVGGTPEFTAAVWIGYDQSGASIEDVEYNTPASVWKKIVEQVSGSEKTFKGDSSVIEAEYCTESGGLAGEKCPSAETGYYTEGSLPERCPLHK